MKFRAFIPFIASSIGTVSASTHSRYSSKSLCSLPGDNYYGYIIEPEITSDSTLAHHRICRGFEGEAHPYDRDSPIWHSHTIEWGEKFCTKSGDDSESCYIPICRRGFECNSFATLPQDEWVGGFFMCPNKEEECTLHNSKPLWPLISTKSPQESKTVVVSYDITGGKPTNLPNLNTNVPLTWASLMRESDKSDSHMAIYLKQYFSGIIGSILQTGDDLFLLSANPNLNINNEQRNVKIQQAPQVYYTKMDVKVTPFESKSLTRRDSFEDNYNSKNRLESVKTQKISNSHLRRAQKPGRVSQIVYKIHNMVSRFFSTVEVNGNGVLILTKKYNEIGEKITVSKRIMRDSNLVFGDNMVL